MPIHIFYHGNDTGPYGTYHFTSQPWKNPWNHDYSHQPEKFRKS
jgi:hypothetical protein